MLTVSLFGHLFLVIFQALFIAAEPFMSSTNRKKPMTLRNFSLVQTLSIIPAIVSRLMQLLPLTIRRKQSPNYARTHSSEQLKAAAVEEVPPASETDPPPEDRAKDGLTLFSSMPLRTRSDTSPWRLLSRKIFNASVRDISKLATCWVRGPSQRKPDKLDVYLRNATTGRSSPSGWRIWQQAKMLPQGSKAFPIAYRPSTWPPDLGPFTRPHHRRRHRHRRRRRCWVSNQEDRLFSRHKRLPLPRTILNLMKAPNSSYL